VPGGQSRAVGRRLSSDEYTLLLANRVRTCKLVLSKGSAYIRRSFTPETPMQPFPMNFVALALAALAKTVIGAIWYSPVLFGAKWLKFVQCSEEDLKRGMPKALVVDIIGNFVMAFVLVHATHYAGAATAAQGAAVGFFNWLGFVAVSTLFSVTFEKRPFALWTINNGFQLIGIVVMGIIVTVWR
jgi:hypothetical protein